MHITPFTLGSATRVFDGVRPLELEQTSWRAAVLVTHVTYRIPTDSAAHAVRASCVRSAKGGLLVSFDLYVFDGDVPADEETITEWMEDDSRWGTGLTPRLAQLVAVLERRYPGLDDDPDHSPWASWPLTQAMVDGRCCGFNIAWSHAERVSSDMRALCSQHGLTLYDPQEGLVLRPNGSPPRAPAKRRWWQRG